jgi:hypothetical protein
VAVFYLRDKMSQKWRSGAMDLVVFGATGGTGRAAVEQALKRGLLPYPWVRLCASG